TTSRWPRLWLPVPVASIWAPPRWRTRSGPRASSASTATAWPSGWTCGSPVTNTGSPPAAGPPTGETCGRCWSGWTPTVLSVTWSPTSARTAHCVARTWSCCARCVPARKLRRSPPVESPASTTCAIWRSWRRATARAVWKARSSARPSTQALSRCRRRWLPSASRIRDDLDADGAPAAAAQNAAGDGDGAEQPVLLHQQLADPLRGVVVEQPRRSADRLAVGLLAQRVAGHHRGAAACADAFDLACVARGPDVDLLVVLRVVHEPHRGRHRLARLAIRGQQDVLLPAQALHAPRLSGLTESGGATWPHHRPARRCRTGRRSRSCVPTCRRCPHCA